MVWDWMYLLIGTFVVNERQVLIEPFLSQTHIETQLFRELGATCFFANTAPVSQLGIGC